MNETVWVVIPSYRPRLESLRRCLATLQHDPVRIVIVTNGESPITLEDIDPGVAARILRDDNPERNISRWWNLGIEWVAEQTCGDHDILILNDDALIPPNGVGKLRSCLREHNLAMVGPNHLGYYEGPVVRINTDLKPISHFDRPAGYCFMLAGEKGIRADEEMRWWLSDDAIEWEARRRGGTGLVPGVRVEHPKWGGTYLDAELQRFFDEDKDKFIRKWGCYPTC